MTLTSLSFFFSNRVDIYSISTLGINLQQTYESPTKAVIAMYERFSSILQNMLLIETDGFFAEIIKNSVVVISMKIFVDVQERIYRHKLAIRWEIYFP